MFYSNCNLPAEYNIIQINLYAGRNRIVSIVGQLLLTSVSKGATSVRLETFWSNIVLCISLARPKLANY